MTMWAETQTQRFAAAVAGAGLSDWLSYYGVNEIDEWMIPFFGASIYDDPAGLCQERSHALRQSRENANPRAGRRPRRRGPYGAIGRVVARTSGLESAGQPGADPTKETSQQTQPNSLDRLLPRTWIGSTNGSARSRRNSLPKSNGGSGNSILPGVHSVTGVLLNGAAFQAK